MSRKPASSSEPAGAAADVRKSTTDLAIEAAIKELVAVAPPLTPEMKARLAEIFSISRHYRKFGAKHPSRDSLGVTRQHPLVGR